MSDSNPPIWPMVWPWQDGQGATMKWSDALNSRRFTISYLLLIGILYAILGLGSRSCATSAEAIICNFTLWPYNLTEAPHLYLFSLITSIWFHNSSDHILLVVVVIVVFLQLSLIHI